MRRIQCLKYLVLATMLMESAVDPFDAQARRAAPAAFREVDFNCPNVHLPASGGRAALARGMPRARTQRQMSGVCPPDD